MNSVCLFRIASPLAETETETETEQALSVALTFVLTFVLPFGSCKMMKKLGNERWNRQGWNGEIENVRWTTDGKWQMADSVHRKKGKGKRNNEDLQ